MQENLVVSARGQITFPAAVRKRFGIRPGDVDIVQDRDGEIDVKPAAVLEIDTYTDEQITEWDEQDRLAPQERRAILRRLGVEIGDCRPVPCCPGQADGARGAFSELHDR